MEDDRIEANNTEKINVGKVVGGVAAAFAAIVLWLSFAPDSVNPGVPGSSGSKDISKQEASLTAEESERAAKTLETKYKPESKKEYIASTTKIGGKKAPIYYKEFFKNPLKFEGTRVNLPGRIMVIEEAAGRTSIQIQVTGNYDSVIVHYDGSVPVYEGDRIMVYGEGGGVQEGNNRMGAAMTWPVINAKYIVKTASAEES